MRNGNPCWSCGFYDCDYGCVADPYQPWTVPEECYLYDEDVINEMIDFYSRSDKNESVDCV